MAFGSRFRVSMPLAGLVTISGLYLAARSLSSAALGSILLLLVFAALSGFFARRSLLPVVAGSLAAMVVLTFWIAEGSIAAALVRRAGRLGGQIEAFERQRKVARLVENPRYLVLGAGEGANEPRFGVRAEVHSTVGTLLFSYGIPGTLLFAWFFRNLIRADVKTSLLLLLPLFVYGIAHNGLRFSPFWICLCTTYYIFGTRLPPEAIPALTIVPARWRSVRPART
jgi:hypothetical protein